MIEENDLFNIQYNNIDPKKGKVLIAEPFLHGKYFGRSVILITDVGDNGAVGLILNKPLTYDLGDFFPELKDYDFSVFLGGPLQTGMLYYVHTLGNLLSDSIQIKDNIYWGGDFEKLMELIKNKKVKHHQIRFFLGYSGWSPGQLEQELEEKSWVVSEITNAEIMEEEIPDLWESSLRDLGGKFRLWANFPENPNMN